MVLPVEIRALLEKMEKAGIRAYVVGGAVRDIIMSREPEDYDIAAETVPQKLLEIFSDYKTNLSGIRFGTVGVETPLGFCEITCCRRESTYKDLRRPDSVEFTCDIESDLRRRDFTVNAMAMDKDCNIIDLFGGCSDIESRIIRAVGDPTKRFLEDALRMIRALRFSSTLGFEIEENTLRALCENFHLCETVAKERAFVELKKLLMGDNVLNVLLSHQKEICSLIPELSPSVGFDQRNPHHIYTVYEHTARSVAACKKDSTLRLAMLLHDIAKPDYFTVDEHGIGHFHGHPEGSAVIAKKILRRLKADRETIDRVCFLIKYHDTRPSATRKSLHKYLCKTGFSGARELLEIRRADLSAQSPDFFFQFEYLDKSEEIINTLEKEGACISIDALAIGGSDLMKIGINKGPQIGETLKKLLSEISSGAVPNEKEALLKRALKITKNKDNRL